MFKVGDIINNCYYLIEHIAIGGTSDIFNAKVLKTKQKCVIIIFFSQLQNNQNEINVRRFIREAYFVSKFSCEISFQFMNWVFIKNIFTL